MIIIIFITIMNMIMIIMENIYSSLLAHKSLLSLYIIVIMQNVDIINLQISIMVTMMMMIIASIIMNLNIIIANSKLFKI